MSDPQRHTFRIIDNTTSRREPSLWRQTVLVVLMSGIFFGPGILADSAAMQWAGFVLFIIMVLICALAWTDEYLTPKQAREKIDAIEKGAA